ncbi:MAG: hypothetical protein AAB787_03030 [Patescibacteria group bacterium]
MDLTGLVVAGICFGLWPVVMAKSGFEGADQMVGYAIPTAVVAVIAWLFGITSGPILNTLICVFVGAGIVAGHGWISMPPVLIASIAGVVNGLGVVSLLEVLGPLSKSKEKVAIAIFVVVLTQLTINSVAGMTMHGTELSIKKAIGFVMAIGAAYMIVTK